jgi:hypothetical protein
MIEYSQHARERMAERGITEAQVAQCLADPDRIEPDDLPDRIRYLRCVRGHTRMLRVVVRIEQRTHVITVLPDKRFRCPPT